MLILLPCEQAFQYSACKDTGAHGADEIRFTNDSYVTHTTGYW